MFKGYGNSTVSVLNIRGESPPHRVRFSSNKSCFQSQGVSSPVSGSSRGFLLFLSLICPAEEGEIR